MRLLSLIAAMLTFVASIAATPYDRLMELSLYDRSLAIIRHYETLHQYPRDEAIGYGHVIQPDEPYERRQYTHAEAEDILRKDFDWLLSYYSDLGKHKYLISALAYNCGIKNANTIAAKLRSGNIDIRADYLHYCHYKGKFHKGLFRRRQIELLLLFSPSHSTNRQTLGHPSR